MSISAQIDAIKQQFPDLDITFVTNPDGIVGESMSATKPGRTFFNQMMSNLESGKYQGVIAWHPDRLSRNSPDASLIVWYIQQGIIQDLKFCNFYFEPTPEGIMMLQMIMSQAQYYSAKLSKDVKRGNAKKRKLGGTTGVAPMGYINNTAYHTIEPDPERFDMVRHAFDLMLTGNFSVAEIAKIMNEEWGFRLLKRKKVGGTPVSKVKNTSNMFNCASYKSTTFSLDISSWNTSNVSTITKAFTNAGKSASTWQITIPKTNGGGLNNTTSRPYGRNTSTYTSPDRGRSFTLSQ